jgi:hypothetical protein
MQVKTPPEKGYKQIVVSRHGLREEDFIGSAIQTKRKLSTRPTSFA